MLDVCGAGVAAGETPLWPALLARDPVADGVFVYAVKTTGVFCLPSCGARRPRPENVVFYPDAAAAVAAGFRACKRCRPEGERRDALIAAACRRIEASEAPPVLAALSAAAGLSPFHFHRLFKRITGVTPRAYFEAKRSARLRALLPKATTVTEAVYEAGFESAGRFYAGAAATLGMAPRKFRALGDGEAIRFGTARCALGVVLVAASEQGICAISLGDDAAALKAGLEKQFARAVLTAGGADFAAMVAAVVAFVEAPRTGLALPLDIRGTAFQRRVWEALRDIPPGATMSYAEVAVRLGAAGAARAVAGACAANGLAVAVPCHRVVRGDGALAGYRWGVERKRRMLEAERDG